jgi:hypothetical protein
MAIVAVKQIIQIKKGDPSYYWSIYGRF